jgi:RimJ/RimL family protein N-acetyltransferase
VVIEEWAIGLGAARRHLCADVGNEASQATVRRADFVQEGVVRRCLEYRNGTRGDAALFARPAGD